ncbi:GMC family oxidoreductase N-terminal domain-containing protein [Neobacillus drentensis]|uniref:GMC family oxidoreductase n=1 Tax=Neobacillus drentensis TaxID=220684 RepID=UPI002FFDCD0D
MKKSKEKNKELTYDYIVIGTGPSGSVIAKTLTDDKKTSVLVLEAGGNYDGDLPIKDSTFALELEEHYFQKYFWQGEGIPQEGLDEQSFEWTTGRLLGGGSSINTMQYVRPTSAVFTEWERLLGPLWSPQQAINNFTKLEKYNGSTDHQEYRGVKGRINIRQAQGNPSTMAEKLVSAIEQATGFSRILDYNDPDTPLGPFTSWQLYQNQYGQRESSSTAFFSSDIMTTDGKGINGRKLSVFFKSTALRVLFKKNRAVGVEFLKEGKCFRASARKKVIISAGINSAQLLMLSGIGPANLLQNANIPVIFDNPNVGQNLKNHTLNFAVFTSSNPMAQHTPLPHDDSNALFTGGAFLPNPTPGADQDRRGVQLIGIGSGDTLTVAIIFLQPKSSGSIKIQSNDPLQIVLADEGFLENIADLEAIKNIYKVYIKNIAANLDPEYQLTSPTLDIINHNDQLEEFIKQNFGHNHHQHGSLRMAPLKQNGVVDSEGHVHGVKDLIVADASIFPITVDGNTSAPAYLIGFTIAQQLLNQDVSDRED